MTNSEIKTALNNSPLFQNAPEAALNMAIEAASIRRFPQGNPIFREDDPGEAVYVLVEGRVKVSRENLEGRERIFTILTPPEVVGEMALVSQLPRSATAHCIDNVTTLFNNDTENVAGLGIGFDKQYFETLQGKLIPIKGALRARYLRFYSRGSNSTAWNNYQEIEVYGQPVKAVSQ